MEKEKDRETPTQLELILPFSTILKVFAALLIAWMLDKLAPMGMLVFLAILLAVTLAPILTWFVRKGAPRWVGIAVIAVGLASCVGLFLAFILPSVFDQLSEVAKDLPKYRDEVLAQIPSNNMFHKAAEKYLRGESGPNTSQWIEKAFSTGQVVASDIFEFLLLLIMSVYLVVDGPRVFKFITDFFSATNNAKLRRTADEVSGVISAYVAGQVITSAIVFVCTLIVLKILKVPAPLTLAVLAGIFDVLPVLGFFMSAIPAILLAMTVSPTAALITAIYCVVYHAVENYFIVPKIYGSRLRLSTLTVLLSLLAADLVAGIAGAIAVLPIVASYPIIERIWLGPWLGRTTIERHKAAHDDLE